MLEFLFNKVEPEISNTVELFSFLNPTWVFSCWVFKSSFFYKARLVVASVRISFKKKFGA